MICANCKKEKKEIAQDGKSKWLCKGCYKKLLWKPELKTCKRCRRQLPMHAKGLCTGCYSSLMSIEEIRLSNSVRYHKIDPVLYLKTTKKCVVCGFDNVVDLHHLDHDKTNNSENNLVGLCPNHHKLIHTQKYQKEMFDILKEKGFNVPDSWYEIGDFYKKPKAQSS